MEHPLGIFFLKLLPNPDMDRPPPVVSNIYELHEVFYMFASRLSFKKGSAALLGLPVIFALSIPLLLTACGGKASSTPGSTSGSTPTPGAASRWTWMGGNNAPGASGVYGTQGVPSTSNVPGGRFGSVSWQDSSGDFWLFGGMVVNMPGGVTAYYLNDLWELNPATKEWTWMSGSKNANAPGVYGTLGTAAASNVPGGRSSSFASWTDRSGNFWLFGGYGVDSTGTLGNLNDLWEFNPTNKAWTWMGGSNTANAKGVYGTLGTPAASNVPGGRTGSVSWIDSSGNFWLFGGGFISTTGTSDTLNDLWEFNPTNKEWTWMSGSNTANATSVCGTLGTAAASNVPGGRAGSVSWIDSSGNFWLFGGSYPDSTGACSFLNDLWEFNPATKEWTWMSGSNTANATGVYGTLGTAAASNVPGGRFGSVSWIDSSGNLWLFGGGGFDSTGTSGQLNDLWEFNPTTREWTWVSGASTVGGGYAQPGVYGTLDTLAPGNVPGGRQNSVSWIDSSGNLWLFGGYGAGSINDTPRFGELNDLWRYQP